MKNCLVVAVFFCAVLIVTQVFCANESIYPDESYSLTDPQKVCMTNLRLLALGLQMYTQDHQGMFPPNDSWGDLVTKGYEKICPGAPKGFFLGCLHCPQDNARYSYAFNANLTKKKISEIDQTETVLFFESGSGKKNTADAGQSWLSNPRHPAGIGLAFVSGRVIFTTTKPDFAPVSLR